MNGEWKLDSFVVKGKHAVEWGYELDLLEKKQWQVSKSQ